MKCRDCVARVKNWGPYGECFCIGVYEPFEIKDLDQECPAYRYNREPVIPKEFEYIDIYTSLGTVMKERRFVTVLDEFEHHYSGEKFYHIRIEYISTYIEGMPVVEYETVDQKKMMSMLDRREEE